MVSIKVEKTEVLIIGSGGAGLRAAIEFFDSKVDVLVLGKCKKRDAHTILATGGINAALGNMDQQDDWRLHAVDTIRDGLYINDPNGVRLLCKNASKAIKELVKFRVSFAHDKNGKIIQRFFGAATYRRACFSGDHTGKAILDALVNQVEKRKIKFRDKIYVFSLLTFNGKVNGAVALDTKTGEIVVFHSKVVVLATGGHSRMFARSSSRIWEGNGDGIYLAHKCRAKFMDMEMFQFHPTGMLYPQEAEGILVTEAVRGEGGILTNAKGERFMHKYDPKRLELSARDVVARAIYMEIKNGLGTKHGGVWLDITHRPKKYILERLPKIYGQFKKYAKIDISKEKMEVAPTAHYSMGGIFVDFNNGKTSVPNLFAIGEVTAGMHGANRLGGNSLLELVVFGRLVSQYIIKNIKNIKYSLLDYNFIKLESKTLRNKLNVRKGADPIKVKRNIQDVMWKYVGVVRTGKDMKKALKEIEKFKKIKLSAGDSLKNNKKIIAALDVQNMLPTCEMIIRSALFRKESRGAHYRSDYPITLEKFRKNIICTPISKGLKLTTNPISAIPKEIRVWLNKKINVQHHLLE